MNLTDVKLKSTTELSTLAQQLGIEETSGMRRQDLVFAVLRAESERSGPVTAEGVIEVLPDGFGFLRAPDANYLPGADDIYVSPSQIRRFDLHTGDTVTGQIRAPKESERYFALLKVERINHRAPDAQRGRVPFDDLTPLYPHEWLQLEHGAGSVDTRAIDLLCPQGKGQRTLIAAPPHANRAALLRDIAHGITANHPDAILIVVLIDERPEEVTEMKRAVGGEVISSTFDEPPSRHVQVAEIVIEKARRLAENGQDVIILLDSITRLARAYNAVLPASGKALPGGFDAAALHKPKRFFGAARKLEEGGSLTIIATVLIESGSPMDEVIYEELEHTCNSTLRLGADPEHPGLDLTHSRTLEDQRLLGEAAAAYARRLRLELRGASPADALARMRNALAAAPNNAELLAAKS
ncbi:MAG TPA: transcription termination factor Rho [Kofleriaceae bacterium]|nr:transcription termination factor Rho [Kofleriaceae bacterium]